MPILPAYCDTCFTAFSSGVFIANASNITMTGNKAGPCPNCGNMGHIPDGVFNVMGNIIEVLSAPNRTVEELKRLATIIKDSRIANETADQLKQTIERDVPQLSPLMNLVIPKTPSDLYALLGLILALITFISPIIHSPSTENKQCPNEIINNEVILNEVINNIYSTSNSNSSRVSDNQPRSSEKFYTYPRPIKGESVSTSKTPLRVQKIGRNEKCPCGSTKKFKHCHGRSSTIYVNCEEMQ